MKIKTDFVTNSSSSSFVVMGATIEPSQIPEEILQKVIEKEEGLTTENLLDYMHEYAELFTKKSGLEYSFGYDYDGEMQVGMCYTKMDDDETLREFKMRTKQLILDTFGIETEVSHIEDCWMDN